MYNHPADCAYTLREGMQLICGDFQVSVVECKDSMDSSLNANQHKIVLKLFISGKSSYAIIEANHELALQQEETLCSPEDEMFSEPEPTYEVKEDDIEENEAEDDQEMEDIAIYGNGSSLESPNDVNDVLESPSEKIALESFKNALLSNLCLVNGRFRLKNNPSDGLRYFSKVKQWNNRSMKSNSLASGDVIRVGEIEFRVDIRSIPRPISDKRREDILSSKDIGAFEYPNWTHRENMEDRHSVIDGFGKHSTDAFFGIYDGHAGRNVADFVSCIFHTVFYLFSYIDF